MILVVRGMAKRLVERALKRAGCVKHRPDTGPHPPLGAAPVARILLMSRDTRTSHRA